VTGSILQEWNMEQSPGLLVWKSKYVSEVIPVYDVYRNTTYV